MIALTMQELQPFLPTVVALFSHRRPWKTVDENCNTLKELQLSLSKSRSRDAFMNANTESFS